MPDRVKEFHCIMPLENIPAVLKHGILSNERAAQMPHDSVAMAAVQARRDCVQVPNGLWLHQYANLYFHARNPMMYARRDHARELCVLQISKGILAEITGVIITDCNASSQYVRFFAPAQLADLNLDAIFARDWNHLNPVEKFRHKSQKCAEVLVPHCVPPSLITGAYAVNQTAAQRLKNLGFALPITIEPDMFFA